MKRWIDFWAVRLSFLICFSAVRVISIRQVFPERLSLLSFNAGTAPLRSVRFEGALLAVVRLSGRV